MAANVANAMGALAQYRQSSIKGYKAKYKIGINSAGSAFEFYIKDLLTGRLYNSDEERQESYSREFSWLGNQNNPPDAIAAGGDAFEIKKHEHQSGTIALNSSMPRDKLSQRDDMLVKGSREAFGGKESLDLFYIVGTVPGDAVESIYFVQGTCYAASPDIYESISRRLSSAIVDSGLELSRTKELGRINRADPLGRASLRIRGMWQIMDPSKAFQGIAPWKGNKEFFAYAIMDREKLGEIGGVPEGVGSKEVEIPNPNNPAKSIEAVVMEVSW